jgi:hypothetical protein
MQRDQLIQFLRRYKLAVQASVAADGTPQAAVVGIAISDQLELVFDTLESTRKYQNLRANPRIALVIGWDHEITAQIEGIVTSPLAPSCSAFVTSISVPIRTVRDRLAWPGITHALVLRRTAIVPDGQPDVAAHQRARSHSL